MGLDVSLKSDKPVPYTGSGIFVRSNGGTREITREDWDRLYPGREPVRVVREMTDELFSWNITHNLSLMASEAGCFEVLWCPENLGITDETPCRHLIPHLNKALARLRSDPEHYRRLNPKNGWGRYEDLMEFIERYRAACEAHPDATIEVSR